MTAIIKADAAQPVRPFASSIVPLAQSEALPAAPREMERAELRDEVTRLRKALEDLQASSKAAAARAHEEGRLQGFEDAVRDERSRCAAIKQGMSDALQVWNDRLVEMEGLAALLTRAALTKLFDEPAKLAALVVPAISRQMQLIRREAVVALRVSKADFPDGAALAALAAATGEALQIVTSPELSEGECFVDLQLGKVEVSPISQWRALDALLCETAGLDRSK